MIKINCGSFRDKYLALFAALLISFSLSAQYDSTKNIQAQSSYGFDNRNTRSRESAIIPNDTPKLALKDSGAIAYKGGYLWTYNGVYWSKISGGAGTDSAAIRSAKQPTDSVNLYLSDLKDSTIKVVFVGDTSWGSGSTDTTSLSDRINQNTADILLRPDSIRRVGVDWQYRKNGAWITYGTDSLGIGGGIDSLRQKLGSDSIRQYSGAIPSFAFRTQRVFNVMDNYGGYGGAKGDGVTNDRDAIQAAMQAAKDSGGVATVYFPNGIYQVDGLVSTVSGSIVNSVIYVPLSTSVVLPGGVDTYAHITLVGESAPSFVTSGGLAASTVYQNGVIIRSSTTGSAFQPAILGSPYDTSYVYGDFNFTDITVKNITFRNSANVASTGPTMSGINFNYIQAFDIENVNVDLDSCMTSTVLPQNAVSGIITSAISGSTPNKIDKVCISGYRNGLYVNGSDHLSVGDISLFCNYNSLNFAAPNNYTATLNRVVSHWAVNDIYTDFSVGNFHLNINSINIESIRNAKWYYHAFAVNDSDNVIKGKIGYRVYNATTSGETNAEFVQAGGNNVSINPLSNGGVFERQGITESGVIGYQSSIGNTTTDYITFGTAPTGFGNKGQNVLLIDAGITSAVATTGVSTIAMSNGMTAANGFIGFLTSYNRSSSISDKRLTLEGYMTGSNADAGAVTRYINNGTSLVNTEHSTSSYKSFATSVSIGTSITTPSEALHVTGNILASGTITPSDRRYKLNIKSIPNALLLINQLKPSTYEYNLKLFPKKGFNTGNQFGLIAQDVEAVIPELVKTYEDGYKAVNYTELIPILIKGVQEQQKQIEELKEEINKLKK